MGIKLDDVQRGYDAWAAKPHNAKWVRKLDGTPIPNDIVVTIFDTLRDLTDSAKCHSCGYDQKAHDYVQHTLGACAAYSPSPQTKRVGST